MRLKIFIPVLSLFILLTTFERGYAQTSNDPPPPAVTLIEQVDLDQDSQPDITYLSAEFVVKYPDVYPAHPTLGKARITLIDGGDDMDRSDVWDKVTDFRNDTWIFDVGGDQSAELIVIFEEQYDQLVAYIYDDQNGDAHGDYSLSGDQLEIAESPYWSVKVTSDSYWIDFASEISLPRRISFFADGYVKCGYGRIDVNSLPRNYQSLSANDGESDFEYWLVDSDADGIANYQWVKRFPDLPRPYTESKDYLFINQSSQKPSPYPDAVFWPLLVTAHGRADEYRVFDHMMGVFFDWERALVWDVGVIGYPIENGMLINNAATGVQPEQVNYVNFENPMPWYDLARDVDDEPELFVRIGDFAPFDTLIFSGCYELPLVRADYAWDQNNDGGWDYEICLAGKYPIPSIVRFPDLAVNSVPYGELPSWALGKTWDTGLFVAAEKRYRGGSEGMYSWDSGPGYINGELVYSPLFSDYITGRINGPLLNVYSEIESGLRGEFSFYIMKTIRLYYCPIDGKLHLTGAQGGLWSLDDGSQIQYTNQDGEDYLDQWQYLVNGRLRRQLNFAGGYLVYSGDNQVTIKSFEGTPSEFEIAPPLTHEEWSAYNRFLGTRSDGYDPGDLSAVLDRFNGQSWHISGAHLRDFRLLEDGFRLVIVLSLGFQVEDILGTLDELSPGGYIIPLSATGFTAKPTVASSVELNIQLDESDDGLIRMQIVAENSGLLDIVDGHVLLTKSCDMTEFPAVLKDEEVNLLPGEKQRFAVFISPDISQVCTYTVEVMDSQSLSLQSGAVLIQPTNTGWVDRVVLELSARRGEWLPAFVLLAVTSLIMGILGISEFQRRIS